MESKLKHLKVVDLKDILAKASVPAPAKANKQDLIARIIASPAALDIYHRQNDTHVQTPEKTSPSQSDDLLAPPEDVDWNVDEGNSEPPAIIPKSAPLQQTSSSGKVKENPNSETTVVALSESSASVVEDPELEKRKKRAARFGVPLVDPPKPKTDSPASRGDRPPGAKGSARPSVTSDIEDVEKLKTRAARFGTAANGLTSQKRPAPTESVDAEELEKRKKRAERFGIKV